MILVDNGSDGDDTASVSSVALGESTDDEDDSDSDVGGDGGDITGYPGHAIMKSFQCSLVVILGAVLCVLIFFLFHRDRMTYGGYVTLVTPGCVVSPDGDGSSTARNRSVNLAASTATACSIWSLDVLALAFGAVTVSVVCHASNVLSSSASFRASVHRRFLASRWNVQIVVVFPTLCAISSSWSGNASVSFMLATVASGTALAVLAASVERAKSLSARGGTRFALHARRHMSSILDTRRPGTLVLWLLQICVVFGLVLGHHVYLLPVGPMPASGYVGVVAFVSLVVAIVTVVLQACPGQVLSSGDYELAWSTLLFLAVLVPAAAVVFAD